jgi:hypothetical protein
MEIKVSTGLKELTWRGTTSNKYFSIHSGLAAANIKNKLRNVKNETDLLNIQLV